MLNDIASITASQTADGSLIAGERDFSGQFDVALGNPPYFSHYQIAEIFLQAARKGLRSGGRVWMVTKHAEWMIARMEQLFCDIEPKEVRGYTVVSGRQR
jgi:16S rRNA (guanine1207-N2)-methyltransferase